LGPIKKEEWPYIEGFGKNTCMFHGGVPHRPFWRKTRTPPADGFDFVALSERIHGVGILGHRMRCGVKAVVGDKQGSASGVPSVGVAGAGYPRVTEITCESGSGRKFVSQLFATICVSCNLHRLTQRTVKFIRWLKNHIDLERDWDDAIARLAKTYSRM
jgi:hypothetical protein